MPQIEHPEPGAPISHTVTIVPQRDGIFFVSATVLADSPTNSVSHLFSIPVIAGAGISAPVASGRAPPLRHARPEEASSPIAVNPRGVSRGNAGQPPIIHSGLGCIVLCQIPRAPGRTPRPRILIRLGPNQPLRSRLAPSERLRSRAPRSMQACTICCAARYGMRTFQVMPDTPEVRALLKLVSEHYEAVDEERRGIVKSMRLMADEARALAREAHQQSSEHLQVILDHIKDVVLTLDEDGRIRTFNPTAERVFGYDAAEVIGRRIDLLVPQIAQNETIPEALQRLAANSGDTLTDLAARESWGVRKDGKMFPAEIAISHAPLSRREMFVVCLREVTERHEAERVAAAEHDVFEKLTANAPLATVLESIARLIESGSARTASSVSVLAEDGSGFSNIVAPRLSQRLRDALGCVPIDICPVDPC